MNYLGLPNYNFLNHKEITILLEGETGTGKTRLAREIHNKYLGHKLPFVHVDLASLRPELIESELFGHAKGSFTGAHIEKKGLIATAQKGTLFLDEISEIDLDVQKKLLKFLENRRFSMVGGVKECEFKGRVVAATNLDLENLIDKKLFRKDLYYRLNVFSFKLPSLKNLVGQLHSLVQQLTLEIIKKFNLKTPPVLSEEYINSLENYHWPGNIRELKNCLEYSILLAQDKNEIGIEFLPQRILSSIRNNKLAKEFEISDFSTFFSEVPIPHSLENAIEIFEKGIFQYFLRKNNGKIKEAATQLKISPNTLLAKKRKYGILC